VQEYCLPTPIVCFPFTSPTVCRLCHHVSTELYKVPRSVTALAFIGLFVPSHVIADSLRSVLSYLRQKREILVDCHVDLLTDWKIEHS